MEIMEIMATLVTMAVWGGIQVMRIAMAT